MINKAISLNYSHVVSEHNPSISKHTNEQIYNLIKSRNNEVDHILSGTKVFEY